MNLDQERGRVLERDVQWAAVASAGQDVDEILSYWTDDAIVVQPGLPVVRGKDALRSYVEESLTIPGFRIDWSSTDVSLSPDGKLAYLTGTNSVSMSGPDGSPIKSHGRVVTIWRKDDDGEWRCAVDIWNEGPAA